jgi:predicted CopG family antitoxin
MATKTITVTETAYDRLKAYKREDESFTDTIVRLTGGERDVWKGFGAMEDVEGFAEAVEDSREEFEADFREREERRYGEPLAPEPEE